MKSLWREADRTHLDSRFTKRVCSVGQTIVVVLHTWDDAPLPHADIATKGPVGNAGAGALTEAEKGRNIWIPIVNTHAEVGVERMTEI